MSESERIGWKLRKQDEANRGFTTMPGATTEVLPDCLIHKIVSCLSFREAARMSILSKTWLKAWLTHPKLIFIVSYLKGNMKIVDDIMERYRDQNIPIEKFELTDYGSYPLIDKWLDIALRNGVKDLVFRPYSEPHTLWIFKILAAKTLRELVLNCCTLMPVSLSTNVSNCYSLRKLSPTSVRFDGNMLQTILNSCPLIVNFVFEYCWRSGRFELNIEKVKLDSLKVLEIKGCGSICEIDAPNLVSFKYMGNKFPDLIIARESSQLEHSEIDIQCYDTLNAAWFCKLRKFLSNSTSVSSFPLFCKMQ